MSCNILRTCTCKLNYPFQDLDSVCQLLSLKRPCAVETTVTEYALYSEYPDYSYMYTAANGKSQNWTGLTTLS